MDSQDLDKMLQQLDVDLCVSFFANLDEKQRKKLYERASQWLTVSKELNLKNEYDQYVSWGSNFENVPTRVLKMRDQREQAKSTGAAAATRSGRREGNRTGARGGACHRHTGRREETGGVS